MKFRILLSGGTSGGHVFPLIAVGQSLTKIARDRGIEIELLAITDNKRWKQEFEKAGIKSYLILTWKWRRYFSFKNFLDALKLPVVFFQALWILFFLMPDLVFCKGGSTSFFPAIAAKIYFIPLFTH